MASFVFAILALCMVVVPCLATDYTVGDTSGWATGVDYSTWVGSKSFKIGDNLVFNYPRTHTVDEVSESDYKTCAVGNAITSDSSGATTIALKTEGSHYFICGVLGHCGNGMKLAVTVKAAGSSTPTTTPTPATSTTTPAAGTGGNTTINKPSSNSAASASGIISPFPAMVATLIAFSVMALSL